MYLAVDDPDAADGTYKEWKKIVVETSDDLGSVTLNPDEYNILPDTKYKYSGGA